MRKDNIVFSVAIDFGAKKTGVYYAKYPQFTNYTDIKKLGEIFGQELEYDQNNTSLLRERTSHRHTRRRYDRLQFAKRLITVILKKYFQFPAENHSQAIGFLMNRRGFTRIDGDFEREYFKKFPKQAWEVLPEDIKQFFKKKTTNNNQETIDILDAFEKLINNSKVTEIEKIYKEIKNKNKEIKKDRLYHEYTKKIKEAAKERILDNLLPSEINHKKHKLFQTSRWIVERLVKEGASELHELCNDNLTINLLDYFNNLQKDSSILKRLSELSFEQQQKKDANSIWDFKSEEFDLIKEEEKGSFDISAKDYEKTHLHHFCYAVYKTYDERTSGSIHRSKFFEEIKKLFEDPHNCKHTYFKNFIQAINECPQLDIDKIYKLICHVSNFELKPLRAYFNDEHYKGGNDDFNNQKLSKIFRIWILKYWWVTAKKDGKEKLEDYKKLKKVWATHENKNNVISFWLKTDPILTIPPYQSLTNRRPPHCQTLLLNEKYLKEHYPLWEQWLEQLISIEGYSEKWQYYTDKLKTLKNKKDNPFISDSESKLRTLQFIMDTSQKFDPLKLNKIWSAYHKINQIKNENGNKEEFQKWKEKLHNIKKESYLSDELKQDMEFDKTGSFGHFLNKYYQTRKKARENRYFLFQEKKDKWSRDKNNFLTVCEHKPRQKKYQILLDIFTVFGLDIELAKKQIPNFKSDYKADNSKEIEEWLINLGGNGIKSLCRESAKAQKDFKGSLKTKIDYVEKRRMQNAELTSVDKALYKIVSKCKNKSFEIAKKLWPDLSEDEQSQKAKKFNSLFSFSQIHNIVFKDRSGFSNTCPICSIDNGLRMEKIDQGIATASHLSGLRVRIIDGAVMRICDSISERISKEIWNGIKDNLFAGSKITIPLILEQNQFEFEPSLKKIKGRKNQNTNMEDTREAFKEKNKRIKSNTICPYEGVSIGDNGEIDHIIPKASKYGELNDEANLIYASRSANQGKKESQYSLEQLHKKYKKEIFKSIISSDYNFDEQIRKFIYENLEVNPDSVEEGDHFKFGKYINFSNLDPKQKIAFRHALFLQRQDPLRKKIIKNLKNRNKTIVNGTQRYLAQCIADKVWRKTKENNKNLKLIQFDYFEYPSDAHHSRSIYPLRKYYERYSQELREKAKEKGQSQKPGSHLIDAQMAFLQAVEDHKNGGTMHMIFPEMETITQGFKNPEEPKSNEFLPLKVYEATVPNKVEYLKLNRKMSKKGYRFHRSFHRSSFYANHFIPLLVNKEGDQIKIRAGFSLMNSFELKNTTVNSAFKCLSFVKNKKLRDWMISNKKSLQQAQNQQNLKSLYSFLSSLFPKTNLFYINWDKQKIHQFFIEEFSTWKMAKSNTTKWNERIVFLDSISYKTQRTPIILKKNANQSSSNNGKDIESIINNQNNFTIKMKNTQLILPIKKEWENLFKEWKAKNSQKTGNELKKEFDSFLRNYFKEKNEFTKHKHFHNKNRKVFSLPIIANVHYLQKRKSWNKKSIYQICADSESRKDNNKFSRSVLYNKTNELKTTINKPFISKNIFKLKEEKQIVQKSYRNIDPDKWLNISKEIVENSGNRWPGNVQKIEYRIYNVTRPEIRLTFEANFNTDHIKAIKENFLTKPKDNFDIRITDSINSRKKNFIYAGSGFNQSIQKILKIYFEGNRRK